MYLMVGTSPESWIPAKDNAEWFLASGVIGHCIFIDETGYNIWTRRSQGRAPRGAPVRRVVNNQRGRNCSVTFAISHEVGLVHHTIRLGSTTLLSFQEFIQETCDEALNSFPDGEPIYLVYDNARPHITSTPEFHRVISMPTFSSSALLSVPKSSRNGSFSLQSWS